MSHDSGNLRPRCTWRDGARVSTLRSSEVCIQVSDMRPESVARRIFGASQSPYGSWHVKFPASSMLAVPRCFATWGYGHKGLVRSALPLVECEAVIVPG